MLGCVGVAVLIGSFNLAAIAPDAFRSAILVAVLVPIGIAGTVILALLGKMRHSATTHDRTSPLSSIDELTGLLTRTAFTSEVEEALDDARFAEDGVRGTLLVIDVDNFKSVNDLYGHAAGDEALHRLATAIRSVLRAADRVGRIGGEEFAVFLPATSPLVGEAVAERIRIAVAKIAFAPAGKPHPLSVSVGGVAYDRYLPFSELFRLADQQLYAAKQKGRDHSAVSPITHYESVPVAA